MGPTGGQQSGARGVGRDLERLEHASRRSGPRWGQLKRSPPQQSGADFSESLSCFVPFVCFRTSVAAARSMAAYKVVCWAATVSYHRWGEIVSSLRSSQSGVSQMVYWWKFTEPYFPFGRVPGTICTPVSRAWNYLPWYLPKAETAKFRN